MKASRVHFSMATLIVALLMLGCSGGNGTSSSSGNSSVPPPGPNDTTSPTVPTNLVANAVSSTQINLSWSASTDNVGVSGYRLYRDGTQIATTSAASYSNTGLSASTTYAYRVAAYDAAANVSAQSSVASETTSAASSGTGNNYYVSTSGNDGNSGALSQPFRTVAHAAAVAAAGDTIYLRGGTYMENRVNFANSGTSSQPITMTSYSGEVATIDGGNNGGNTQPLNIDGRSYIVLDHLTIKGGFPAGIYLGANNPADTHDITIQYCDISGWHGDDNNGGIYLYGGAAMDNIAILRNYIHDHAATSITGAAAVIIFQAKTVTIKNNEFARTSQGVYYKHSFDDPSITTVENNYIHDMQRQSLSWSRRNGVIKNNVLDNVGGSNHQIEVFQEAADCSHLISDSNQIIHNTILGGINGISLSREGGFGCPGAIETTVRDNLIYDWSSSEYQGLGVFVYNYSGMPYSPDGHTRADHNLLYSSINATPIKVNGTSYAIGAAPLTVNTANISQAPIFVNYAQRAAALSNLALTAGSPGKNVASDGKDMGADVTLVGPQ